MLQRRQMQGVQGTHCNWEWLHGAGENGWLHLQQGDSTRQFTGSLAMGACQAAGVQAGPHFVFDQSAGDQGFVPQPFGRTAVLGEKFGKDNGGIDVDHRSLRSSSSSDSSSLNGSTGCAAGGGPAWGRAGGVNQPLRTASANIASASTGLLPALGEAISATTRSRSVTKTVSPEAAKRTYSLKRLLSVFIPTAFMLLKVGTGSYLVK